jgi:hypothetical protein
LFTRFFTSLLSGAALLLLLATLPVCADTFTAATADELIAAVEQANANGEADTITLVGNPVMELADSLNVHQDLTIVGPGTFSRDGIYAVFEVVGGALTLDSLTFQECTTQAGVVLVNNAALSVIRCAFLHNTAVGEGGFYGGAITGYSADITLTDSAFTGNTTDISAGAVAMDGGSLTVSSCTFTENASPYEDTLGFGALAGAITAMSCPMTLTDSTFSANTSMGTGGAVSGVYGYVRLDGCTFTENSAAILGGAVSVVGPGMEATGCTFTGNRSFIGGAICYQLHANEFDEFETDYLMWMTDCVFHDNSVEGKVLPGATEAFTGGGAIAVIGDAVALNCRFTNNRARIIHAADEMMVEAYGGAVLSGGGYFGAANCVFSANSVTSVNTSSFGGAQAIGGAIGTVGNWYYEMFAVNCTFSGNTANASATAPDMASPVGGGIALAGPANLTNCILWGNLANGTPNQTEYIVGDWPYPYVSHCDIQGGIWAGMGNIDAAPRFVANPGPGVDGIWGTTDDTPGDLALTADSPCIDMGSNDAFNPEFLPTDLAGNPRVVNEIVDMGAYEYQGGTAADTTPPVITTPGNLAATATSPAGAVVDFTVTAEDDVDGPVTPSVAPASGSLFPLGTTSVNCSATDAAGNNATKSFTVTVTYAWSGFLQPVEPPDAQGISPSVFKAGSTVPIKFALTGDSAGITTATARISYAKISSSVVGSQIEATSTAAATTGNLFRYDPATGLYIFNWSTKGLTPGTYQITIDLGDRVTRLVIISLK